MRLKIRLFSLLFAFSVLAGCGGGGGYGSAAPKLHGLPEEPRWSSFGSGQVTFSYPSDINLKRLEARLRTRWFSISSSERALFSGSYPIEERISARLNSLLLRVEKILGMNVPFMHLKIKILKNRLELEQEYSKLFGAVQNYRSFYLHSQATIYTSMQDISDSVISHEMAHAVIDHYFKVIPPEKTAELLATYVDSHLEEG
ncbi:MAG: hypothetical protein WC417_01655 [Candidatus Omnitrophota bacterium]|jgi:hypothetical protein